MPKTHKGQDNRVNAYDSVRKIVLYDQLPDYEKNALSRETHPVHGDAPSIIFVHQTGITIDIFEHLCYTIDQI